MHFTSDCLNAFDRHGVVARSTETTHVAVTLHADHALACSELEELVLQVLILWLQDEGDVHERTAVLLGSADEEFVAVNFGIHDFGALLSQLLHWRDTLPSASSFTMTKVRPAIARFF